MAGISVKKEREIFTKRTIAMDIRERMARVEEKLTVIPDIADDVKTILLKMSHKDGVDKEKEKQEAREHAKTKIQSGGIAAIVTALGQAIAQWVK